MRQVGSSPAPLLTAKEYYLRFFQKKIPTSLPPASEGKRETGLAVGIARQYVSKTKLLGQYLDFQKKTLQKTEVRFLLLKSTMEKTKVGFLLLK